MSLSDRLSNALPVGGDEANSTTDEPPTKFDAFDLYYEGEVDGKPTLLKRLKKKLRKKEPKLPTLPRAERVPDDQLPAFDPGMAFKPLDEVVAEREEFDVTVDPSDGLYSPDSIDSPDNDEPDETLVEHLVESPLESSIETSIADPSDPVETPAEVTDAEVHAPIEPPAEIEDRATVTASTEIETSEAEVPLEDDPLEDVPIDAVPDEDAPSTVPQSTGASEAAAAAISATNLLSDHAKDEQFWSPYASSFDELEITGPQSTRSDRSTPPPTAEGSASWELSTVADTAEEAVPEPEVASFEFATVEPSEPDTPAASNVTSFGDAPAPVGADADITPIEPSFPEAGDAAELADATESSDPEDAWDAPTPVEEFAFAPNVLDDPDADETVLHETVLHETDVDETDVDETDVDRPEAEAAPLPDFLQSSSTKDEVSPLEDFAQVVSPMPAELDPLAVPAATSAVEPFPENEVPSSFVDELIPVLQPEADSADVGPADLDTAEVDPFDADPAVAVPQPALTDDDFPLGADVAPTETFSELLSLGQDIEPQEPFVDPTSEPAVPTLASSITSFDDLPTGVETLSLTDLPFASEDDPIGEGGIDFADLPYDNDPSYSEEFHPARRASDDLDDVESLETPAPAAIAPEIEIEPLAPVEAQPITQFEQAEAGGATELPSRAEPKMPPPPMLDLGPTDGQLSSVAASTPRTPKSKSRRSFFKRHRNPSSESVECPSCGTPTQSDLVDQDAGLRHLSCDQCFKIWDQPIG